MASPANIYWDSCIWISLINEEPGRIEACRHTYDLAQKGRLQIWTSTLTLAEVFKLKCEGTAIGIDEKNDELFEKMLEQDFVTRVQVDSDVGKLARRLLRKFSKIKKPQDAMHVATAIMSNVDEFHTYDGVNLLPLDGQLITFGGQPLKFCNPPDPPKPTHGPLFEAETKVETNGGGEAKAG